MAEKGKKIPKRRLSIENISSRTDEEKGFDDMVAITLGDKSKLSDAKTSDPSNKKLLDSFGNVISKDVHKRKILKIIAVVCIAIAVTVGVGFEYYREQTDGKIRVYYSAEDLVGEDYKAVVKKLERQGFTNVETEAIDDLVTGWVTEEGEVEAVEIDGDDDFSSNLRYYPDAEVIVKYHSFSSD